MNMKLEIRPKIWIHYILMYMLICLNGSTWFTKNQYLIVGAVILVYALLAIGNRKYRRREYIGFPIFLLIAIMFVRFISGGIGIDMWELYAAQILIVYMCYVWDPEFALTRFIKLVTIMGAISCIFWGLACTNASLLQSVLTHTQMGTKDFYGLFLYTFVPQHSTRNTGIFTEPGRYQTVICAALFIMALFYESLHLTKKQYKVCFAICIITLLTIQSTTGYIGFVIIVLGVLFANKRKIPQTTRRIIFTLLGISLGVLLVDYYKNGLNSIIGNVLLTKMAETDVSDGYSSGGARVRTISACIELIKMKPWGAGMTNITNFIMGNSLYSYNSAGAGIMTYAVALGIVPSIVTLIWMLKPFVNNKKIYLMIVWFALYLNTGFAQTYAFYPAYLLIPVALSYSIRLKVKNEIELEG